MEKRTQKQIFIGLIFVLIIGGASFGFIDKFFIIEATCFDGIKNGTEEDVDCGTLACGTACREPIRPLEVSLEKLFQIKSGDYDFVAKIVNPNTAHGASSIQYTLITSAGDRSGTTYILPGQTKYLVLTSFRTDIVASAPKLDIQSVQWEKLNVPAGEVSLINRRGDFSNSANESFFEGVIFNGSNYDFDSVDVSVVLFDASNSIVGVNQTEIRTLLSKTERSFKVVWPLPQVGVARTEVQVSTNLFENSNFIKSYGTQERFQEFY